MDCSDAREILQSVLDGASYMQDDQVAEHLQECKECRDWKAGMDALLSSIGAISDLPEIDISVIVMARLPERHPAATVRSGRNLNRSLGWAIACWFAGALVLIATGGIWMLVTGTSSAELMVWVCKAGASLLRWVVSQIEVVSIAIKATWNAASLLLPQLWDIALNNKLPLLMIVGVDISIFVVGVTVWRHRIMTRLQMIL